MFFPPNGAYRQFNSKVVFLQLFEGCVALMVYECRFCILAETSIKTAGLWTQNNSPLGTPWIRRILSGQYPRVTARPCGSAPKSQRRRHIWQDFIKSTVFSCSMYFDLISPCIYQVIISETIMSRKTIYTVQGSIIESTIQSSLRNTSE